MGEASTDDGLTRRELLQAAAAVGAGSPGQGNSIGTTLPFGPMAAMTNPIFLGHN